MEDFSQKPFTVIFFTCNHCPYAKAVEDRLILLGNEYGSKADFKKVDEGTPSLDFIPFSVAYSNKVVIFEGASRHYSDPNSTSKASLRNIPPINSPLVSEVSETGIISLSSLSCVQILSFNWVKPF